MSDLADFANITNTATLDIYAAMVFDDPEPKSIDVMIGKDPHKLVEATEDVACKFQNAAMKSAKLTDGKVTGMDGAADAEPILVAGCLFRVLNDVKGGQRLIPVTVAEVRARPSRIVRDLFERAKIISGLEDKDTPETLRKRIASDTKKLEELTDTKDPSKTLSDVALGNS